MVWGGAAWRDIWAEELSRLGGREGKEESRPMLRFLASQPWVAGGGGVGWLSALNWGE